jgi:hypothetical protein
LFVWSVYNGSGVESETTEFSVNISYPISGTTIQNATNPMNLTFNVSGSKDIYLCWLNTNEGNYLNSSTYNNNTNNRLYFYVSNLTSEIETLKVTCTRNGQTRADTVIVTYNNSNATSATNVSFSVGILEPINNDTTILYSVAVTFTVNGSKPNYFCSLYLNGTLQSTNSSVINNTLTNLTMNFTQNVPLSYYVWCYDTLSSVSNTSAARQIFVNLPIPSSGVPADVGNGNQQYTNTTTTSTTVVSGGTTTTLSQGKKGTDSLALLVGILAVITLVIIIVIGFYWFKNRNKEDKTYDKK